MKLAHLSLCIIVFATAGAAGDSLQESCNAHDATHDGMSLLQVELDMRLHGSSVSEAPAHKVREPYRQELKNMGDSHYNGDIEVGGQVLNGIFDTGSFELIVMSTQCTICFLSVDSYNPANSSNYRPGTEMFHQHSYGSGVVLDWKAFDDVSVGDGHFISIDQPFWAVYSHVMPIVLGADFAAIVGIGKRGSVQKTANRSETGLVQALEPMSDRFSVFFERPPLSPGWWTWDAKVPTGATALNVIGSIHWGLNLTDVRLGSGAGLNNSEAETIGCENGCGAIMDTGTSLIAAPRAAIDSIALAIKRLDPNCSNLDEMPDLVFELDGKRFSLPPSSYVGILDGIINPTMENFLFPKSGPYCQPLFIAMDQDTQYGPMWIFGMPFFREYHTTFESLAATPRSPRSTIYTATPGDDCRASDADGAHGGGSATLLEGRVRRKQTPLRIDASKLRLPTLLTRADGAGKVML